MSFNTMMTSKPAKSKAELEQEAREAANRKEREIVENLLETAKQHVNKDVHEGCSAKRTEYNGTLAITTKHGTANVAICFERTKSPTSSTYRPIYNGPHCCKVGGYGDVRRFPPGKKGINFDKVAEALIENANAQIFQQQRRDRERTGYARSMAICKEITGYEFGGTHFTTTNSGLVKFEAYLNREQAIAMVEFCKANGIMK